MSDFKLPCNCNWRAGCGPNLLCPEHGNTHHMAAEISAQRARIKKIEDENRRLREGPIANRVSIHGMYDCHLFCKIKGRTVEEVIDYWLEKCAKPNMTRLGRDEDPVDIGPPALCPAVVLAGDKELRRVGPMVHRASDHDTLAAYRLALLGDPDIPTLLATQEEEVKNERN